MIWTAGTLLNNGQYRIEDELSRKGGFGMTYRAKHVILGTTVVIKAPHEHRQSEPNYGDFVNCFIKEGKTLDRIAEKQHPNIVKVREFFYEGKTPCMVMNYVEGETLEDLVLRSGAIPEETILPWIVTMAQALSQVHSLGMIHRDANPANIIINTDNQPILIDFGIALNIQPRATTMMAAFAGHKTFAPLEQLEPEEDSPDSAVYRDPKLDIYCLAATLYFAITGQYPKGAFARQRGLNNKRQDALIAPKKLNPAITDRTNRAILTGMSFHPGDRPASMEDWYKMLTGDRNIPRLTRRRMLQYGGWAASGFAIAVIGDQAVKALRGNAPAPILLPGPPEPTIASLSLTPQDFKSFTLDDRGKPIQATPGSNRYLEEDLGNGIKLRMVLVEGGTFMMGSPPEEALRSEDEGPQHQVKVPNFFMGQFTITQAQWAAIAKLPQVRRPLSPDPAQFKDKDNPIERVSWNEAIEFCDRLTKLTNRPYRLPSEAEWEYACRAGTKTPFHTGPTIITDLANYRGLDDSQGDRGTFLGNYGKGPKGKYRGRTIAANEFPPNAFGLYQMHGNVWEWCLDNWHQGYKDAPSDGLAWLDKDADSSSDRVIRGGSWNYSPQFCRSAYRYSLAPDNRDFNLGFRVVFRPAPQDSSVSLYTS
jgi:formylglycine-generating enzyme required for sulfatase activity